MRRAACRALGVALVVVTSGCGIGGVIFPARTREVPHAEPTVPATRIDCPADGRGIDGVRSEIGHAAAAPPAGFVPASVTICAAELRPTRDDSVSLYTITVQQAPVTQALTDALQLPDLEYDPPDQEAAVCAASYQIKPYVLLVDADHRGYRPALPLDQCDNLRLPVSNALNELTLVPQRSYRVRVPF